MVANHVLPPSDPEATRMIDLGEAIDVSSFYDREPELATLKRWIVQEHCRLGAFWEVLRPMNSQNAHYLVRARTR